MATKIWAKQESGLTAVWLKWDPPVFSCFMTTLNDTFEQELALGDEGYDSGSESLSIPTPLCRVPQQYHVSASENLSFGPATPQAYSP